MKYAILIYDENTASPSPEPPDPAVMGQIMAEYNAFAKEINDAGVNLGGEALQPTPTATTVRVRDGKTVTTDGPFAETKEGLGGFYLIEAKDLDEALAWAAKCPGSWYGTVEVRPVWDLSEYQNADQHQAVGAA
ncbi:MAG: YciI family protein [Chloroflexota bacterium]